MNKSHSTLDKCEYFYLRLKYFTHCTVLQWNQELEKVNFCPKRQITNLVTLAEHNRKRKQHDPQGGEMNSRQFLVTNLKNKTFKSCVKHL